ncbi:MAG: helix-turn-helix domain-containing protein [Bacilli bacterium]|nr:helix-turn-helix domain-containing protein [Bacilli bacterium]
MKTIGERIKNKRKELGLTQAELAQKLNVTDRAVSKWEVDEGNPDFSILPNLADVLGVTLDYLIKGKDPEKEEIVMSRMEYVCKTHDVEEFKKLNIRKPTDRDEAGHNIYEYIEKYDASEILSEINPGILSNNLHNLYAKIDSFFVLCIKFDNLKALENNGFFTFHENLSLIYINQYVKYMVQEGYKAKKITNKYFSAHKERFNPEKSKYVLNASLNCIEPYKTAAKEVIKTENKDAIAAVIPHIIEFNKNELAIEKRPDHHTYYKDSFSRYEINNSYYHVYLNKEEIVTLLKLGFIEEAKYFNSIAKKEDKVEDNQFEKYTIIKSGKKSKQDLRLLDVMKGPLLIVERLEATKDNEFIVACLKEYPINSIELTDKLLAGKDEKKIYEFLVDNDLDSCARQMLTKGLTSDVIDMIEKNIIGYSRAEARTRSLISRMADKKDGLFKEIDKMNAKYNKADLLTKYKSKVDLEKFYEGSGDTSYYANLLKKDNVKEATLELCKLLETKLNSFGVKGEDLSVKLKNYLENKWPSMEDDDWGYMVPAKRPEICDLLHRLRIMRNNYLHADIKDAKPLSKEEILKCAEFIINKMER